MAGGPESMALAFRFVALGATGAAPGADAAVLPARAVLPGAGDAGRTRAQGTRIADVEPVWPDDLRPPPTPTDGLPASMPLLRSGGRPVIGANGKPVRYPEDLPPEMFVERGRRLRHLAPTALLTVLALDLARFRQAGEWDAQRRAGRFVPEWVDYATIAIGLYAAAAGMSEDGILAIQDRYAQYNSNFSSADMDAEYPHLAQRNVRNTALGFELYRFEWKSRDAQRN